MQISKRGLDLIKDFEKLRLVAYPDGGGVWTIGWGHTGPEVVKGLTCTREQADSWLYTDVAIATTAVDGCVVIPINQNQYDALVSFEYNTGALRKSTLLRYLNAGQTTEAAAEFPKWNHDNGKVVDGLTRRRLAEQALFMAWG